MTLLWWVGVWLLLGAPVLVLVAGLCRAGHQEDVARRYVDDRSGAATGRAEEESALWATTDPLR